MVRRCGHPPPQLVRHERCVRQNGAGTLPLVLVDELELELAVDPSASRAHFFELQINTEAEVLKVADRFQKFPEHDEAVTAWFAALQWPVSDRFIVDFDIFAWRHEPVAPEQPRTLRVTRTVMEDVPAAALVAFLHSADVKGLLASNHRKHVVIQRLDNGNIGVTVRDVPS